MAFLLVLYAYSESAHARRNAAFFGAHGILPAAVADHVFVLNGPHTLAGESWLERPNVAALERENRCYDFGAWGAGLDYARRRLHGDLARYTHYVLMNASTGPANVGLVGTSLNCWTSLAETHLQSMFLVTHARGLFEVAAAFLDEADDCKETHSEAVFRGEIPLSRAFLTANYSLRTQLLAFENTALDHPGVVTPAAARNEGADGRRLYDLCVALLDHNRHAGDLQYPAEYGGTDISPLETVFVKAGPRGVAAQAVDAYSRWAVPANSASDPTCPADDPGRTCL